MATRWWWCSARAAALLGLAACVRTTTVSYLPSPEQPRLSILDGQGTLARFLGVECERLRAEGRAAGEALVVVALDAAGLATSAEVTRSTGDTRVDGLFGAVAAQLQLDAPAGAAGGATPRAELDAGYRCTEEGAVSIVLDRRPGT